MDNFHNDYLAKTACFFQPKKSDILQKSKGSQFAQNLISQRKPKPYIQVMEDFEVRKNIRLRVKSCCDLLSSDRVDNRAKERILTKSKKLLKESQKQIHDKEGQPRDRVHSQGSINFKTLDQKKIKNSQNNQKMKTEIIKTRARDQNYFLNQKVCQTLQQKNLVSKTHLNSISQDQNQLYYQIFQDYSNQMKPVVKGNRFKCLLQPTLEKTPQKLPEQMSNIPSSRRFPNLSDFRKSTLSIFQYENLKTIKVGKKPFLQGRAQMNMVNRVFRD